ncbi:hypothetical protein SADUNF_Sadunf10G0069100 [Salix dunnii]|uniref:Uncharacterized protein n=1 Tax=Salix dunnii TaxID=1413687 RepID=A0A835JST1_9ROSI|nr:hypothetical protein SADUNF_Sadunf10G0069100 [Salix dunnii]
MSDSVIENEQDECLWEMMQMNNCLLLQNHDCSGKEKTTFVFSFNILHCRSLYKAGGVVGTRYLVTLRKDHGGSETLLVEPITDAVVSLKDKFFYLEHLWVQGHLYYGLTTMLIRVEKPTTQTYQIDYYFKIFPQLPLHFCSQSASIKAQNMEAT